MIAIGGIIYLSFDIKYIGALLFALGLFTILVFGFKLYTGAVGYFPDKNLPVIWLGNLVGTVAASLMVLCTRYGAALREKAGAIVSVKLNDSIISIFILSVFCGILMFIAVDAYREKKLTIATFLAVPTFILCGFEHCVANMVYFTLAKMWSFRAVGYLLVMTLGNSLGAVIFCRLAKDRNKQA